MLGSITAKAKASWKENVEQQTTKKRALPKESKDDSNNESVTSPLKKRKLSASALSASKVTTKSQSKSKKSKSKKPKSIAGVKPRGKAKLGNKSKLKNAQMIYDLPLEQQKQRSVVKLQNMPTGFEEDELDTFFRQFGMVTRFCLKRNRHGKSIRYGYVEFAHPDVAKIVVDTLNCTSLYGQMLQCSEIAPHRVHGAQFFKTNTIEQARLNKKFDNERVRWRNAAMINNLTFQFDEWHNKLSADEEQLNQHLKKQGIEYKFDGLRKEIQRQVQQRKERENGDAIEKYVVQP
eukprot:CAMPEP_0202702906 /NCGR_PEP_ID=MMETSP1385-20130828/15825_1 /ASSEMBLY_ACC=CAM_ASM_000861 /TAXON_ID=933848 /ORGANISM="Elphidium margaritaceum" /LENGTH=290 /DNA_ID=CAMNT_0049360653 /DNA_START=38 /DNA_END=910 /DNA_ORIENTATION=-